MIDPRYLAAGLDLGSTHVKAGWLGRDGDIVGLLRGPAPPLEFRGEQCVSNPEAWEQVAATLLQQVTTGPGAGLPLGMASQRSSFLLWQRGDGRPVTPVISWQDRRARSWLQHHPQRREEAERRSGLILTAHHVAPKLAALQEEDSGLRTALHAGKLLFGTLETFLAWRWSGHKVHSTNPTMAARTGLLDPESLDWCPELLDLFGVPLKALPRIEPTAGRAHALDWGGFLTATAADQAACAAAMLDGDDHRALVSIGTGTFVMGPGCTTGQRREGYLTMVLPAGTGTTPRGLLEGPIHAGVPRSWPGQAGGGFPARDPAPGVFCLPDRAGVGAPHWRADLGPVFSLTPEPGLRGHVMVEGLLFRIAEVLTGLCAGLPQPRIVMTAAGGGRNRSLAVALAALLGRSVAISRDAEPALAGILRLAAGRPVRGGKIETEIAPGGGTYLAGKQRQWAGWLRQVLAQDRDSS